METKALMSYNLRLNKTSYIKEVISFMKSNGLLPERKPKGYFRKSMVKGMLISNKAGTTSVLHQYYQYFFNRDELKMN